MKKKCLLQILLAWPRDRGLHLVGWMENRGGQNRPHEKEWLAFGTNSLLLQLLHMLWLKSAYTPAYSLKPRTILHWPHALCSQWVCPCKGFLMQTPVTASQIQMVLSWDPQMMCWPSGEKATENTPQIWPSRGLTTIAPISASQIQTVMSLDPETMWHPLGE